MKCLRFKEIGIGKEFFFFFLISSIGKELRTLELLKQTWRISTKRQLVHTTIRTLKKKFFKHFNPKVPNPLTPIPKITSVEGRKRTAEERKRLFYRGAGKSYQPSSSTIHIYTRVSYK
jgi:hypothetical protein